MAILFQDNSLMDLILLRCMNYILLEFRTCMIVNSDANIDIKSYNLHEPFFNFPDS